MTRSITVLGPPSDELAPLCDALKAAVGTEVDVEVLASKRELLEKLRLGLNCELVLLDGELGDGTQDGLSILAELRREAPRLPVIVAAATGDVAAAEQAIAAGATDFLVRGEALEQRVATALGKVRGLSELIEQNRILAEQNRLLRETARARYRIIGESPQALDVIDRIERVAKIPRPVLITGERGTGKELVARAIHDAVGESTRPFVAVNCAAFTDTLLESELFGHEKGAFTGADSRSQGRFEQASDGTLFLDEIGNMSLPFQQKILRVVEYGLFTRVGGREEIRSDARIIAATNADLPRKMEDGEFLRDLYDRLAFEVINVPPLRLREGDVEILARHFFREFMQEIPALGGKRLAPAALAALRRYPFPGNVRELKNIIERAVYRDTTNEITATDMGLLEGATANPSPLGTSFEEKVEHCRRQLITEALQAAEGNQAAAARNLGLTYDQYRHYHRKYGL